MSFKPFSFVGKVHHFLEILDWCEYMDVDTEN